MLTRVIFACDESAAKGYADRDESFSGEVGVFAGIMVGEENLSALTAQFQAVVAQYIPQSGKLHIADLSVLAQESLRRDIFEGIRANKIPCFWYAIHVAGFHRAYFDLKKRFDEIRSRPPSRFKPSGGRLAPPSLHVSLFEGLYGNLIAFCTERNRMDLEIEIRTDTVDLPIARYFKRAASDLLAFGPRTSELTAFDTETGNIVKIQLRSQIENPDVLGTFAKVHKLDFKIGLENDGLVLAADVLANGLAYLFHNRASEERYRALNTASAVAKHPLAQHLDSFRNGRGYSFADTFYRHPNDPDSE